MYKICIKKMIKKILLMDIKEALNMWQDIPFTWMRKFNIVKMSNLPRWIYKSNTIPKTQWHFLLNLTVNSEVHMGEMYIKIAKIVLKKKNDPVCVWELGLTESKATFVPDFSAFKCSFSLHLVIKSQGKPFLVVGGGLTPISQEGWACGTGLATQKSPRLWLKGYACHQR